MDQERAVNKIVRDMRMCGLITLNQFREERVEEVKFFVTMAFVAGFDLRRTEINKGNNNRRIAYYAKNGKKIKEYPSIAEASRKLKIGRGTIDDILYGKTKGRRNTGNYFRYADEDTL